MKASKASVCNAYWNRKTDRPEFMGVYPMGTGLEIEVPYRHYWELQTILPHLPHEKFSLLELACGAGRWAFSLAPQLSSYVGVDISAPQIEVALKKSRADNLDNLKFLLGDALAFETQPASFDVVFLGSVCMYSDDETAHKLFDKAHSWLKPGGLLIEHITTIVGDTTYTRQDATYFAVYRKTKDFITMVTQHGFSFEHDMRSYSFLRGARGMWNTPELKIFLQWGMQNAPEETFTLMKSWSEAISEQDGPYLYEKDKIYDHRFFVFTR